MPHTPQDGREGIDAAEAVRKHLRKSSPNNDPAAGQAIHEIVGCMASSDAGRLVDLCVRLEAAERENARLREGLSRADAWNTYDLVKGLLPAVQAHARRLTLAYALTPPDTRSPASPAGDKQE